MLKHAYELGVALAFEEAGLSKEAGMGDWAARNLPTFTTWVNRLFQGGAAGRVGGAVSKLPAPVASRAAPLATTAAGRKAVPGLARAQAAGQIRTARVNPNEFGQVSSPFAISNQQIGQALKRGGI